VRLLYRVSRSKYARDLSGEGARLGGGRWNIKGSAIVYTAENRSLAAMEALIHMMSADFLIGRKMVSIGVPESIIPLEINIASLPADWRNYPPSLNTATIGSKWAMSGESLLLRVPSAIIPHEFNILINPAHPEIKSVKIVDVDDFNYDDRLHR